MEESDSAVMTASLREPAAFAAVFDRHAGVLLRFLARRVDPLEADSLLGEVFRIAFERRASFDPQWESARPWLYGIASNLVAKHGRSRARRLRATAALAARRSHEDDPADRAAAVVDAARRWARVADAMAELPPAERDTLLLFAWEELSYGEVAIALGVPVGTVRSRLNRGRQRLRELINEPEASDD